jgi:phosphoglycolate phosphatase-like HAD superfamily hydrolase
MEKYNIPKEHTLFITDTLGDIREAEIADVPTVAVTWGAHDRSYFKQEEHKNIVAIVDSVDELKNFVWKF